MNGTVQSNGVISRPRSIAFAPSGKVLSFEIILDRRDGPNGVGVFSPGDLLTGHVRLELAQRLTVSNIDLLVQGTCQVAWKARSPQGEAVVTDDEVYLNDIAELVSKRSNEMVTLSPGEHIFPFACDLPGQLPATFTGSHGNVSYMVKVVVQADRNELAHAEPCIATCIFLLESRLSMQVLSDHLNAFRIDYKHPVKTSGLSTGSSSVKVSLFLPRRAYDIGDSIVVNMSLTNTSKRAVKSMSLGLVMEATYRAHGQTTKERLLVADHEDAFVVRQLESRQWRHVGISVPRCIPPSTVYPPGLPPPSTLISIEYFLEFKAELERTQESLRLETRVLIGLELPDEMKLTSTAMETGSNFTDGVRTDDATSGRQSMTPRILYQGPREPRIPANPQPQLPTTSAELQRPLYIEVRKPELHPPPSSKQVPRQQQQPQPQLPQLYSPPARVESDSQVISMRFTDELDDHSPYGQPYHLQPQAPQPLHHQTKVSRNPLFVPEDGANGYHDGTDPARHFENGGQNRSDRMLTALGASMENGVEEVLY